MREQINLVTFPSSPLIVYTAFWKDGASLTLTMVITRFSVSVVCPSDTVIAMVTVVVVRVS